MDNRESRRFGGMLLRNFALIGGCFVVIILIALVVMANYTTNSVLAQASETNRLMLSQRMMRVETAVHNTKLLLIRLASTQEAEEFLRENALFESQYSRYENTNKLMQLMTRDTLYSSYFHSLYLYSITRDEVVTDDMGLLPRSAYYDQGWYQLYESYQPGQPAKPVLRLLSQEFYKKYVLTFIQQSPLLLTSRSGLFVANLDVTRLFLAEGDTPFAVLGQDGVVIACTDEGLIGQSAQALNLPEDVLDGTCTGMFDFKGARAMSTSALSQSTGWRFISIDTLETYNARISQLRGAVALAIAIQVPFSLLLAYLLSKRMYMPVKRVLAILDERDDMAVTLGAKAMGKDELAYLSQTVVRTLDKNKALNQTLEERLRLLDDARLKMLQNQMNPHFLYNTLESINWMAIERLRGDNEVSDAVCTLSELLRDCLRSAPLVRLEEEVAQAQRYIKLQKLRFGDGLEARFILEEGTGDCAVPSMTLQPILENAIKYGLRERIGQGQGMVRVQAARKDDQLAITVTDNGGGMPGEAMDALRRQINDTGTDRRPSEHVGLTNVQQRLHILFGLNAGVTIKNVQNGGFQVEIVIPAAEISDQR